MKTIHSIKPLQTTLKKWRQQGLTIALVPTMGNLHAGHLELVKAAKKKADKVVVSIFVNPTQFGKDEDFESYPRTEQQDASLLTSHQVDILWLPAVDEIYHPNAKTEINLIGLADLHCGVKRKGHFSGVATIVCKLFNIVQADYAFFGEKDFQQLAIIRLMVRDLNLPINIESVDIIREKDGLAMSSRNRYLTVEQRQLAPKLYQTLLKARDAVLENQHRFVTIEQKLKQDLNSAGFEVDYFNICLATDLLPATKKDKKIVILVAAKLGKPRLIDNIFFQIP